MAAVVAVVPVVAVVAVVAVVTVGLTVTVIPIHPAHRLGQQPGDRHQDSPCGQRSKPHHGSAARFDVEERQKHQYLCEVPAGDQRSGQGRRLRKHQRAHGAYRVERLLGQSAQETTNRQPSEEDATRHEHQDDDRAPGCLGQNPTLPGPDAQSQVGRCCDDQPEQQHESGRDTAAVPHHEGLHRGPGRMPPGLARSARSSSSLTGTSASPTRSSATASSARHGARTNAR